MSLRAGRTSQLPLAIRACLRTCFDTIRALIPEYEHARIDTKSMCRHRNSIRSVMRAKAYAPQYQTHPDIGTESGCERSSKQSMSAASKAYQHLDMGTESVCERSPPAQ